jgi:hypothetical protein
MSNINGDLLWDTFVKKRPNEKLQKRANQLSGTFSSFAESICNRR